MWAGALAVVSVGPERLSEKKKRKNRQSGLSYPARTLLASLSVIHGSVPALSFVKPSPAFSFFAFQGIHSFSPSASASSSVIK